MKLTHIIAASATVMFMTNCSSTRESAEHPFGYQLYTVREDLSTKEGVVETLNHTHEMGFDLVESFGYMNGQFFGYSPEEFASEIKDANMSSPSGHYLPMQLADTVVRPIDPSTITQFLDAAEALGQHWVVIPWMSPAWRTPEGYDMIIEYMMRLGVEANKRGMRAAYHNHDFEFEHLDPNDPESQLAYEFLLENLDPEFVDFEMDIHWVAFAGEDPVKWLNAYPGRFPLWHVKDFAEDRNQVPVGQGVINWEDVFSTANVAGLRHYFIEQDVCSGMKAVECLKESIDWAKTQEYMK
jgi:sugar phosphate isomerase/epimerase